MQQQMQSDSLGNQQIQQVQQHMSHQQATQQQMAQQQVAQQQIVQQQVAQQQITQQQMTQQQIAQQQISQQQIAQQQMTQQKISQQQIAQQQISQQQIAQQQISQQQIAQQQMFQQQMAQQQLAQQQMAQQQVMLCPVRLVYETQLLLQPGDQIQPNQAILINPQNPPPWMQNRQNQVLYVQQFPNNIMPSVQPQIDQNQMYVQPNFSGFSQVYNQIVTPIQEQLRPTLQFTNVLPSSIIQNVQGNIGQNAQTVSNERSNAQTSFGQIQPSAAQSIGNSVLNMPNITFTMANTAPNLSTPRPIMANINPNISYANTNISHTNTNRPMTYSVSNLSNTTHTATMSTNTQTIIAKDASNRQAVNTPAQTVNQNVLNVQKPMELQRQTVYRHVRPMQQYQNVRPTHVQSSANLQNLQQFVTNVSVNTSQNNTQTRPQQTIAANIPAIVPQTMQTGPRQRNASPMTVTKTNPVPGANLVRSAPINTYRPIQPRPQQYRHIMPNLMAMNPPHRFPQTSQPQHMPNIAITPITQENKPSNSNTNITLPTNAVPVTNTITINRKRKSESPDEIQNKRNTTQLDNLHHTKPLVMDINRSNDVTMTPVNKVDDKNIKEALKVTTKQIEITPTNKDLNEDDKKIVNEVTAVATAAQQNVPKENEIKSKIDVETKEVSTSTSEGNGIRPNDKNAHTTQKLVRNTVFSQARVRIPLDIQNIQLSSVPTTDADVVDKNILKTYEKVKENKTEPPKVEPQNKVTVTENLEKTELKSDIKPDIVDEGFTKKNVEIMSVSEMKGKELQVVDGTIRKEERDSYVLTHVLDGFVIQESNTAFPIRKPLKEKILYHNKRVEAEQDMLKIEVKINNSKILNLSQLQIDQIKQDQGKHEEISDNAVKTEKTEKIENTEKTENIEKTDNIEKTEKTDKIEKTEGDNPFANVDATIVKSWTVEELATHLSKYEWRETIDVLREHEIDGESLFLVSKNQLVTIGVNENHVDIIYEFIKN